MRTSGKRSARRALARSISLALRLARSDHRIAHDGFGRRLAQRLLEERAEHRALGAVGDLDQHVPGMRFAEGIALAGNMAQHELDAKARHQLEPGDPLAARLAQPREQGNRRLRIVDRHDRRRARTRLGKELQHGGGDDAERALGPNE